MHRVSLRCPVRARSGADQRNGWRALSGADEPERDSRVGWQEADRAVWRWPTSLSEPWSLEACLASAPLASPRGRSSAAGRGPRL